MPTGFRVGLDPAALSGDESRGFSLSLGAPFMAPLLCLLAITCVGIKLWTLN